MSAVAGVAYAHIVRREGYCGGKAAIDNTRVRVNNVAFLQKQGKSPEEIQNIYLDLSLAQVHAALTYYYDHRSEIEAEHERERAEHLNRGPAR